MADDMRITVLGDTHGDFHWIDSYVTTFAQNNRSNTIFQVGDFGYWEGHNSGITFLNNLSKSLKENNIRLIFLLGNHEDWLTIESYRSSEKSPEGFYKVRDNIWWAPCGLQWKWRDTLFGAMGGAYSIDRGNRLLNETYFLEEVVSDEDAANVIDSTDPKSVDIMFAHDSGVYVDMKLHMMQRKKRRILDIAGSVESRRQLQKVINHWKPDTVIHGHWHLNYQDHVDDVNYYGLDCEHQGLHSLALITLRDNEASLTLPLQNLARSIPIRNEGAKVEP